MNVSKGIKKGTDEQGREQLLLKKCSGFREVIEIIHENKIKEVWNYIKAMG